MNWLDIGLLVFIAVAAVAGYRFGAVQAAAILAGILLGIGLASRLGGDVSSWFSPLTNNGDAQEMLGFLAVFLLVLAGALIASSLARHLLSKIMLGWADTIGGLAVGAIFAMAAASAVLANVQDFPVLDLESTIAESPVGSFLADNFDVVLRGVRVLPEGYGT